MRFTRVWLVTGAASCAVVASVSTVGAQLDGDAPTVQRPLTPGGETEVNYYDDGTLTSSTNIPEASMFRTAGEGGGGVPRPCHTYTWTRYEPNPNPALDPVTSLPIDPQIAVEYSQDSLAWTYFEIIPTGTWTPEQQGVMDDGDFWFSDGEVDMSSTHRFGELYYQTNAPLATGYRRFDVRCGHSPDYPGGLDLGNIAYVEVAMTDPFWNPLVRLGVLWGMVQLPSYRVIAPPEVATYGGLVVNMPTWLQVESDAWRPYFTPVDQYMGWYSQLGLFPSELSFEVVGPGGDDVACAPTASAVRDGVIPGAPEDLPRYYELGQLGDDCTWVPQAPGRVTIRGARISYDVLLTISGYSEWLAPYVWYSDPLTLPVGELRNVNVTPPGGIGN